MSARAERKVVTVLFADLVGFTSRSEELDPEDVLGLLAPYQTRLRAELERFGGTVEKFIGDAVMGLFGAPVAHEDDPERAVRAALAIREFAAEEGIELRIGINTGEALVQLGADPAAGETMATGDVVNTAARLQAAAPVGGVVVGVRTHEATRQTIVYDAADPVEAKGKAQPIPVWLARSARSRATVELVRGAPLVGRRRELDVLADALARARAERSPQLVTIVGVPGIGKSRLVLELFEFVEADPDILSWRQGRCLPYGEGVTFWALGEMVKAQLGILEDDDAADTETKLREGVGDAWVAGHLRPLVGLASDAEAGGDRRGEAFTAWRRFFEDLAVERPLVLVFEDLHWADENLLDFVDHLVDWATAVPLLVVASARPELLTRRPGWGGGKPNASTISLSPLSDAETAELVATLLDRAVLPADTQASLLARAGGNPLYAEQFVRMLEERGSVDETALPETVQGIIAARLDLLDPAQKALLHDAAVVGKAFWLGALAAVGRGDPAELEQRLHELERRELVRRQRTPAVTGEVEYAFRHVLVRDVSYGQIPRAERAEKHLHAAAWIESLGRAEDHAEMLAHHYLQALELASAAGLDTHAFAGRARAALGEAGDRAFALHGYAAAARFYRAARDLLTVGDPTSGRLLLRLGRTLAVLGEADEALVEEARDVLLAAGDAEGATEAVNELCEITWIAGESDKMAAHLAQARELAEGLPRNRARARVVSNASRFAMLASRDEEAIELAQEAIEMADELGFLEIKAAALNNYGTARANLHDLGGLDVLREAIELADEIEAPFESTRARGNMAAQLWQLGELQSAYDLWFEAAETSHRYGQTGFARWFDGILCPHSYALGDWQGARGRIDAFLAAVEAAGSHYLAGECFTVRARLKLALDDVDGAIRDAERAVELTRRARDPQNLYPTLANAAVVFGETGDTERAAALVEGFVDAVPGAALGYAAVFLHVLAWTVAGSDRADELAGAIGSDASFPWARAALAYLRGDVVAAADVCGAMGAVTEEAHDRLAAAKLLAADGHRAEADEQLYRALAFYRSVGASRYVREGEALLAASA